MICINLEEFILECKANKQRKADNIIRSEKMYASFHKEACLHASYGDMYKPKRFLFWSRCPVCNNKLNYDEHDFKMFSSYIFVMIYTCIKCNYRYVLDLGLFGKELESCKEKETI